MGRALALAGFVIGLGVVVLQFVISMPASMEAGRSLGGSIVFFFSYFTILTNIAVVLVYAAALGFGPLSGFFGRASVRAGVAVAIAVVAIVYISILARLWSPQGLFRLTDILLHYITPALYLAWWSLFGRDGTTRLANLPYWLVYPLLYLVYALARSPIAGEVPYPFLDHRANGWASVAQASGAMLVLFVVVGVVVVLLDRLPAPSTSSRTVRTP